MKFVLQRYSCYNLRTQVKVVTISDQHRLSHSAAIPTHMSAGHSVVMVYVVESRQEVRNDNGQIKYPCIIRLCLTLSYILRVEVHRHIR